MEARVLGARARLIGLIVLASCGRIGFSSGPIDDAPIQTADTPVGAACTTDRECGRCARCDTANTCAVEPVTDVFLGHRSICYLGTGGTRWCAGENVDGVLGLGDTIDRSFPERDRALDGWSRVWMTYYGSSYGARDDDSFYQWGPSVTPTPVRQTQSAMSIRQILGDLAPVCFVDDQAQANCDSSGSAWLSINATSDHTCGVKTDHTLWCWGKNVTNALGRPELMADEMAPDPLQVGLNANWLEVGVGGNLDVKASCARTIDNAVYCWGDSTYAGGATDPGPNPSKIFDGAVELAMNWEHACARTVTGEVWCWGNDTYGGFVAIGATAAQEPTRIPGIYDRMVLGGHHTCLHDATGWHCFGWNTAGQLGNGTTTNDGALVDLCP